MPRSARCLLLAIGLAVALAACDNVVDAPPPPARTPLIEATLIAGQDTATARIRWLIAGAPEPAPAAESEVALGIAIDGGPLVPLRFDPRHQVYRARVVINAGGRYRLAGTVGGLTIEAVTTLPAGFSVAAPSGDRLVLAPAGTAASGPFAVVPFRWSGAGATMFATDSALIVPESNYTRDTGGELLIFGTRIRLLALNRDLDQYLYGVPAPATNIAGGFGVFGGAIVVTKEVVWQ